MRKHKFDPRHQRQYSSSFQYSNHFVRRLNVRLKSKASENVTTRRINASPLLVLLMQNYQTRLFDVYPFNQFLERKVIFIQSTRCKKKRIDDEISKHIFLK